MGEMCILPDNQVGYTLPFEWNSLEYYDENTCLIHYTDMHTQPWVSTENGFGYLWLREVRRMLDEQGLSWAALKKEIDLGYFRPSLIDEPLIDSIPLPLKLVKLVSVAVPVSAGLPAVRASLSVMA